MLFLHQRNLGRDLQIDHIGDPALHLKESGRFRARQDLIDDGHVLNAQLRDCRVQRAGRRLSRICQHRAIDQRAEALGANIP